MLAHPLALLVRSSPLAVSMVTQISQLKGVYDLLGMHTFKHLPWASVELSVTSTFSGVCVRHVSIEKV